MVNPATDVLFYTGSSFRKLTIKNHVYEEILKNIVYRLMKLKMTHSLHYGTYALLIFNFRRDLMFGQFRIQILHSYLEYHMATLAQIVLKVKESE